jgi:hypothetical protein
MTVRWFTRAALAAAGGVLLVATAACGSGNAGGSTGGSGSAGGESAGPSTGSSTIPSAEIQAPPPSPEGTGVEPPQTRRNQPAVELAALPVGGSSDLDHSPSCVEVNWSGQPVPHGVAVRVTVVDVEGDFREFRGGSCQDPCRGYLFTTGNGPCQVGVSWTPPDQTRELKGTVALGGQCVEPDPATCHQVSGAVSADAKGQVVTLSAPPLTETSDSASPADSDGSSASPADSGNSSAAAG